MEYVYHMYMMYYMYIYINVKPVFFFLKKTFDELGVSNLPRPCGMQSS